MKLNHKEAAMRYVVRCIVLITITLLSLPESVFAAAIRGGGSVDPAATSGSQLSVHVRLQQSPGGPATGTISFVTPLHVFLSTGEGPSFVDLTVTGGNLATGEISGTLTITIGSPAVVYFLDVPFTGTVTPGGKDVGGISFNAPGVGSLGVTITAGNLAYAP